MHTDEGRLQAASTTQWEATYSFLPPQRPITLPFLFLFFLVSFVFLWLTLVLAFLLHMYSSSFAGYWVSRHSPNQHPAAVRWEEITRLPRVGGGGGFWVAREAAAVSVFLFVEKVTVIASHCVNTLPFRYFVKCFHGRSLLLVGKKTVQAIRRLVSHSGVDFVVLM